MRKASYPGSDIVIEQTLAPGANYYQYIASYKSEGLKIYALMTVPMGEKPKTGWPVVIFNHGYIRLASTAQLSDTLLTWLLLPGAVTLSSSRTIAGMAARRAAHRAAMARRTMRLTCSMPSAP